MYTHDLVIHEKENDRADSRKPKKKKIKKYSRQHRLNEKYEREKDISFLKIISSSLSTSRKLHNSTEISNDIPPMQVPHRIFSALPPFSLSNSAIISASED